MEDLAMEVPKMLELAIAARPLGKLDMDLEDINEDKTIKINHPFGRGL
jgi:hypothetical protein